jgi:hypothetical protein
MEDDDTSSDGQSAQNDNPKIYKMNNSKNDELITVGLNQFKFILRTSQFDDDAGQNLVERDAAQIASGAPAAAKRMEDKNGPSTGVGSGGGVGCAGMATNGRGKVFLGQEDRGRQP